MTSVQTVVARKKTSGTIAASRLWTGKKLAGGSDTASDAQREIDVIRVGVIGYGYWGPNLVRNFSELEEASVAAVCDLRAERLAAARNRFPGIRTTSDAGEIATSPDIDAIVVATPVSTHFELAMGALRAGKHVLVEKPIAQNSSDAHKLIEEAARHGLVLMVDHTFVYTGAVRKVRELVEQGQLGDIYYYDSVRVNLGLFQHDMSVIWDLAVHDLSIMDYILTSSPVAVSATGMSHVKGHPENIAYLTLFFDNDMIAHIHVNWLAPVKVRRTLIGGSDKMIVFDDLEPSEKIKVYDRGITIDSDNLYKVLISYRTGDMHAPHLDLTEALRTEALHFVDCVNGKCKPTTNGQSGLRVVRTLEAASASMKKRGRLVEIK